MITGHDEKRDTGLSKSKQSVIRYVNDLPGDATPKEKVASMNYQIRSGLRGIPEDAVEVFKEVGASSPSLDSGPEREIKSEVSVPE